MAGSFARYLARRSVRGQARDTQRADDNPSSFGTVVKGSKCEQCGAEPNLPFAAKAVLKQRRTSFCIANTSIDRNVCCGNGLALRFRADGVVSIIARVPWCLTRTGQSADNRNVQGVPRQGAETPPGPPDLRSGGARKPFEPDPGRTGVGTG